MQFAFELMDESLERMYEGKLNLARDIALRANALFEELNIKIERVKNLNNLGMIYSEMGHDAMGIPCFLDSLDIAIDEKMYDLSSAIYNNLGTVFMREKSFDRAIIYFQQALEMLNKAYEYDMANIKDYNDFSILLHINLALISCYKEDFKKALFYYEESKKMLAHLQDKMVGHIYQSTEVLILWKLGEHENIVSRVDSLLDAFNHIEYSTNLIEIMSYIFEVLREMKDYNRWEKALKILENHIVGDVGLGVRLQALECWLDFYKETGDMERYTQSCVKFYELSKANEAEENEKRSNAYEMEAEMRRSRREKRCNDKKIYLDTLTGIGNRNKMLKDSKKYIADSIKEDHSIAVGIIDVDYFKECNDTYGHLEGDECLKKVASIIQTAVGDRGSVYRYGGDEFLVLIPVINDKSLIAMAKEISDNLEKAHIRNEKSPISEYVTLSQGYTRATAEEGDTIETLIELADKVLYSVKHEGRNNYKFIPFDEIDLCD